MFIYYINFEKANDEIFKKRGNWRKYKKGDKKIDFVYVDRYIKFDKKFLYDLDVKIENFAMILEGKNKREIVDLFLEDPKTKKYVPDQIAFNPREIEKEVLDFIKPKQIYIAKPVGGAHGDNIVIITNKKEFLANVSDFKKTSYRRDKFIKDNKNWVLQKYITKPMLYNKKKFHIRANVILDDNGIGFLDKDFYLLYSVKDFKLSDFKDKDIHDTHLGDNFDVIYINDQDYGDFKESDYKRIKKEIIKICKIFIKKAKIKCYPGLESCFVLFGLDIMFERDFKPIFIEANITSAIKFRHKYILEAVMQAIIDKKFPPENKPKEKKRFIKL